MPDAPSTLPSRLYLIVDPLDTGRDPLDLATAMLAGGARLLQLRLKNAPAGVLLDTARRLRERCARAGATLIVNDRADVALAAGAAGVHVGQDDLPIDRLRPLVGPRCLLGLSTHDETQLRAGDGSAADYLSLGPIFPTRSKARPDPVVGCERLREARGLTRKPLVAIGGIARETAPEVLAAGADSLAVIAAVVRAPDVERATAELIEAVGG